MSIVGKTIWVTTEFLETEESFIEHWEGYLPNITEEDAYDEVISVMEKFNHNRRPYEEERSIISFVLEEVTDDS